jgi:hypothetical protein
MPTKMWLSRSWMVQRSRRCQLPVLSARNAKTEQRFGGCSRQGLPTRLLPNFIDAQSAATRGATTHSSAHYYAKKQSRYVIICKSILRRSISFLFNKSKMFHDMMIRKCIYYLQKREREKRERHTCIQTINLVSRPVCKKKSNV